MIVGLSSFTAHYPHLKHHQKYPYRGGRKNWIGSTVTANQTNLEWLLRRAPVERYTRKERQNSDLLPYWRKPKGPHIGTDITAQVERGRAIAFAPH